MEKSEILEKLFSLHRFGIKPGLERTFLLAEFYGNPQNKIKTIHVTGTNGKGSVCTMLASILKEAGYKVGLYTSPHLVDFNERIQINGELISDSDLVRIARPLLDKSEQTEATFFEITTIIAFQYFAEQNVDFAIIETGMGGRFDSTNIILPELSVITKIDLDHIEYLGDTIEKIAFEKAGIIKPNTPIILSQNTNTVIDVIQNQALELNSDFIFSDYNYSNLMIDDNFKMSVDITISDLIYKVKNSHLTGIHQISNIATVISTLKQLISKAIAIIPDEAFEKGITNLKSNFFIKSRIELISTNPPIIYDASHNLDGIKALANTISISPYKDSEWLIVFAVMADKDLKSILQELRKISENIILTKPSISRAADLNILKNYANEIGFENIEIIDNPIDAYNFALKSKKATILAGSFYLVGEILENT